MGIILGVITAITTAAVTVSKALAVVGLAIQGIKAIGSMIVSLGKALGLIKPETNVDELGDKAIQSGYKPEDYNSYADYVKAVEEFDELDPEKSKAISEEEKIRKGTELAAGVTIEKFGDYPIAEFLTTLGGKYGHFTESKMFEIGKIIGEDPSKISSILNYVNGSEKDVSKNEAAINTLVHVEKAVNPGMSDIEAKKAVINARG